MNKNSYWFLKISLWIILVYLYDFVCTDDKFCLLFRKITEKKFNRVYIILSEVVFLGPISLIFCVQNKKKNRFFSIDQKQYIS